MKDLDSKDLDVLVHRYLEDRDSLSPRELDTLITALRIDPDLAIAVRDQLLLDDLLAQKMALDRRNFVAQVEQRIADERRGHAELNQQVADLRSMAAAERTRAASGRRGWRWARYALAFAALTVIAVGIYMAQPRPPHQPAIAKVIAVDGDVMSEKEGSSDAAKVGDSLEGSQRILVPRGGSITLTYQDGTELRVKGDSAVTFGDEQPADAKQVRIERGEVVADIKQQPVGPMRFSTPHAVATAPKSLLRLVVTEESTLLDVSEGKVKFDRLTDQRPLMVAENESGMASRDAIQR